jgi:hypothetical protein
MIKVNLILEELFHTTITTNLHYNMHIFTIYALILNIHDFVIHSKHQIHSYFI